jgi:hypothetical protein
MIKEKLTIASVVDEIVFAEFDSEDPEELITALINQIYEECLEYHRKNSYESKFPYNYIFRRYIKVKRKAVAK